MVGHQTPAAQPLARPHTLVIDGEAWEYLKTLIPRRTGQGALVSRLLMEHKVRREVGEKYRQAATREQWDHTGLCVD
jgi:hypothetical protein